MDELLKRIKGASSGEDLQKLQDECQDALEALNESQLDTLLLAVVRAGHEGLMMTVGSTCLLPATASLWNGKATLLDDIADAIKGCIEEPFAADDSDKHYANFLIKLVGCLKSCVSYQVYISKLFEIVELSMKTDQHSSPIHSAAQALISVIDLRHNLQLVARGTLKVVNFIRVYPTLTDAPAFHTSEAFLNHAYLTLADEATVTLDSLTAPVQHAESVTNVSELYAYVLPSVSDLFAFCAQQPMTLDDSFTLSYLFVHFVFEHYLCDGYIDSSVLKPMIGTLLNLQNNKDEQTRLRAEEILVVVLEKEGYGSLFRSHIEQSVDLITEGKLTKLLPFLVDFYKVAPASVESRLERLFAALQRANPNPARVHILSLLVEVARRSAACITKQQLATMVDYLKEPGDVQKAVSLLEAVAASRLEDVQLHENAILKTLFSRPLLLARSGVLLSMLTTSESKATANLQMLVNRLELVKDATYRVALLNNMRLIGLSYPKALAHYRVLFESLCSDDRLKRHCERLLKIIDSAMGVTATAKVRPDDKKPLVKSQKTTRTSEKTPPNTAETPWLTTVSTLLNEECDNDWKSVAVRLGYSNDDVARCIGLPDPCLAMLQLWLASNTSTHATYALYRVLLDVNRTDAATIVAQSLIDVEAEADAESEETTSVFLSYQWASLRQVKLLRRHLALAGYAAWMDVHALGVGDKTRATSDAAMRAAEVVVCCVSELYVQSASCSREVTLAASLAKPIVPLLLDNSTWPPPGSTGRVFGDHLCIHFQSQPPNNLDQRKEKEKEKDPYWRDDNFSELLMQLRYVHAPDLSIISRESPYKNWWLPAPDLVYDSNRRVSMGLPKEQGLRDVFLSYQWDMQPYVKVLYRRLTQLGYTCWFDVLHMGGEASLYDKIDRGVKSCRVVLSCVSKKYALSPSCRREVNLANVLKKPIVPLLLEEVSWPLRGPVGSVLAQLTYLDFSKHVFRIKGQNPMFDQLTSRIDAHVFDAEQSTLPRIGSLNDNVGVSVNRRMSLNKYAGGGGKATQPGSNRSNSYSNTQQDAYRRMSLNVVQSNKNSQLASSEYAYGYFAESNNGTVMKQSSSEKARPRQSMVRRASYVNKSQTQNSVQTKLPLINTSGHTKASNA